MLSATLDLAVTGAESIGVLVLAGLAAIGDGRRAR